jgi:hypothetical protein
VQGRDDAARQRVIVPDHNPQQSADWTSDSIKKCQPALEVGVWSAETVFVCALTLLGRSPQSFPIVEFVDKPPMGVSALAAAYTRHDDRHIVVITSTPAFATVQRAKDRCRDLEALREIAGLLAHEEWHVLHGADEESAYNAQLTALLFAGAEQNGPLYNKVVKAKLLVMATLKRDSHATMLARRAPIDISPHGFDSR